jgi:hypothetical protein
MKNNPVYYPAIMLLLLLSFTACEKKTYTVDGTITNVAEIGVLSASINLYTQGTSDIVYSATSDAEGQFTLNNVEEGYYDLGAVADGYEESKISINLRNALTQNFILKGLADISGIVMDAQTGLGIDSIRVGFTTDAAITDVADAQLILKTDIEGNFSLDGFPTGIFRIIIDTPAYFLRIIDNIVLVEGSNTIGDICLITPPDDGSYRIVLTWGFDPADLDAHITGPDGSGGRFQVCYWNKMSEDSSVNLDLDDSWRYGPETVTLSSLNEGTYRYSVHNYSDQSANGGLEIFESPAKVDIYNADELINEFIAPSFDSLSGNTWRVFEMEVAGNNVTINPVNTYLFAEDDSDIATFKAHKKNP